MGKSAGEKVWDRVEGSHTMSLHRFMAYVVGLTGVGLFWTAAAAFMTAAIPLHWGVRALFCFLALALPHVGIRIALTSEKPSVSLAGYALVALPMGALLAPVVATVAGVSLGNVFLVTGLIVVTFGTIGALYPRSLEHWVTWILVAISLLLFSRLGLLVGLILGVEVGSVLTGLSWLEWISVVVFSFVVIYDVNRALRVQRTLNNAIGCALALYLDFLNIFVNLLGIHSKE